MMAGSLPLPTGRRGQALAIGLTLLAAVLLWVVVGGPVLGWYQERAAALEQQRQMASRMAGLGQEIPALRAAIRAAGLQEAGDQVLLPGANDAIAGANLQSALQDLANQVGTSLDSAELLPVQQAGALRSVSMQVSVTATWPVLIQLLEAIGTGLPRMIVAQFSVINAAQGGSGQDQPMQANFTVTAYRAGPS